MTNVEQLHLSSEQEIMRKKISVNCVHVLCVCLHADCWGEKITASEACCRILREKVLNMQCGLFPPFWPTPEHCIRFDVPACQKDSSQKKGHATEKNWLNARPEAAGKGAAQLSEGSKCQAEMKTCNWKLGSMNVAEDKDKKTFCLDLGVSSEVTEISTYNLTILAPITVHFVRIKSCQGLIWNTMSCFPSLTVELISRCCSCTHNSKNHEIVNFKH